MDGVAYTTGIPLDNQHKEIHLNLNYASHFLDNPTRFRSELIGVVTHEMVHAYQWDAQGSCPGVSFSWQSIVESEFSYWMLS
jgi:hypothetical protein